MHIFEYNTQCSNRAMNADYNGASEGSQGQQETSSSASSNLSSVAIVRVSRVVTEYLLYLCIYVEQW